MGDSTKAKQYFWVLFDVLIAAIIVNLAFFVMPAIQQYTNSIYPSRTITVSGEGKAYVAPDIAQLSFSVVSRGQDPVAIADQNNKKINTAIAFVKEQSIEAKDIKTTGYSLNPEYRYDEETGVSSITSYSLTQTVTLKIRDFSKISPILGGLPPLGINQITGVQFTVDDPEKFLADARKEAFGKAAAKAEVMALQVGVPLGKVVTFSEYTGGPYYPLYAEAAFGRGGDSIPPVAAPVIEPGQEEITVQVSVTYALR